MLGYQGNMVPLKGYQGKILRVNLTDRKVTTIKTETYAEYIGGHGMATAIFWDLCKDKTIDGFDPGNVISIMGSPISGTITPSAAGRCEITGIGVQSSPIGWYTRSNFGGRFVGMMKYAGWDGIVLEGKANKPVWIDIRNDEVNIRDAGNLWGLNTWETQEEIWEEVNNSLTKTGWKPLNSTTDAGYTTQKPAVLTIGAAGEHLSRIGCLIHDAGNGAGQGGFGGIWGSKNLKAISIIGTGSVVPADPNALIAARINSKENYAVDLKNPTDGWGGSLGFSSDPDNEHGVKFSSGRPQSCQGCIAGCRGRYEDGIGNESSCIDGMFYMGANIGKFGKLTPDNNIAGDLAQKYGINVYELMRGIDYIIALNKMGILGPGKQIDCPLDFAEAGTAEFADQLMHMIAYREGIGDDMAEGFYRAAQRWGRLEEDLKTGILYYSYWGCPEHGYDPRCEVEWGYGSILGERDIAEHDFNTLYWNPSDELMLNKKPYLPAEEVVKICVEKMVPFEGTMGMLDYSTENIYSEDIAKLVAWHRHYTRFWKQSVLFCDWRWADFYNAYAPDNRGQTGDDGEPKFLNAVTGGNLTFSEGMELGRRIWYFDQAIWTLQGRTREITVFPEYIYTLPNKITFTPPGYWLPGKVDGKWQYIDVLGRSLDRDKVEEWKTKYYTLEGWDIKTGWPTRKALESVGLKFVADELEKNNKLGQEQSV